MSILGSIISSIFGKSATAAGPGSATEGTTPSAGVDVAAILDDLAAHSDDDDLDWRKSIVDPMKILKLDSRLAARKQLAQECITQGAPRTRLR